MGRRIRRAYSSFYRDSANFVTTPWGDMKHWTSSYDQRFVYDAPGSWNLSASYYADSENYFVSRDVSCGWGPDLSATEHGAGGIGGLAIITDDSTNPAAVDVAIYDGHGNLVSVRDTATNELAGFQYGPFGETAAAKGPRADRFCFRWSTKYADVETGLSYYGYRYYSPGMGRWCSRDPVGELAFDCNVYQSCLGNPTSRLDFLGLFPDDLDALVNPSAVFPFLWPLNSAVTDVLIRNMYLYLGFDTTGAALFCYWYSGIGVPVRTTDGYMGEYMKENRLLAVHVRSELINNRASNLQNIFLRSHAEIENGYQTGYEMLHGTNADVGDFTIAGTMTPTGTSSDECQEFAYDLEYEWNDRIDPNFGYGGDVAAWVFFQSVSALGNGRRPQDYVIQIRWHSRGTVLVRNGIIRSGTGYPFNVPWTGQSNSDLRRTIRGDLRDLIDRL